MSRHLIDEMSTSRYRAVLIGAIVMLAVANTCRAVEIVNSERVFEPIVDGESAYSWSPDGKQVLLAESDQTHRRIHLCVYDITNRKKSKCIFFLRSQADLGIHSLDWKDPYIHVAVGFHDGSAVIYRLPVPNWRASDYRELDIGQFKSLPYDQVRGTPVWDQWEKVLFCTGEDERSGIQIFPKGGKPTKYVSGAYPAVTRRYLWYSEISEKDLVIDGISRIEKAPRRKSRLTTGNHDVSVSPRQDEKGALFIRRKAGTSETALYAYVEGRGAVGPLAVGDTTVDEELISIQLSPDGTRAMLLSSSVHPTDKHKVVVMFRLLSVRW